MIWMRDEGQKPRIRGQAISETSIPNLPVEIWFRIFEFATHIPGSLDINDYAAIAAFTRDHHRICLSNRFKSSMQLKLSFCLVCKYWNAIVQPLLFQHLQITSGERACVIAQVLDIPIGLKDQEKPGKWTLRIDLDLEGVHYWAPRHTRAMFRIFERCRNLLCFSEALSGDDPKTYCPSIFIQQLGLNTKLKRMEVRLDDGVLRAINDCLNDQLQVLWLVPNNPVPFTFQQHLSSQRICMPNLRALIATSDSPQRTNKFDLPNLRACILNWEMLYYPITNKNTVEYLSMPCVSDLNLWPNLTTISVSAWMLVSQKVTWQGTLRHAKIECIIIEDIDFNRGKVPDGIFDSISSQLGQNLSTFLSPYQFPRLRRIKILLPIMSGAHPPRWLPEEEKPFWCVWFQDCNNCGVQIEVSEGAMEWTEDHWTEYCYDELLDILAINEEEWLIDEGRANGVEG